MRQTRTDVWIVDAGSDKVFRYAGAADRLSDSQNAASSFSLNKGNRNPTGIVTDGTYLWVVDDSTTDKVFKYTLSGSLVGSWTISSGGGSPTGITIDPANPSDIWIVDNASDLVYQFTAAANRTSGSQSPAASFALAAGNTNPQGIADPPAIGATVTGAAVSQAPSDLLMSHAPRDVHHRTLQAQAGPWSAAAAIDQLLAEPESFWTRKSRVWPAAI